MQLGLQLKYLLRVLEIYFKSYFIKLLCKINFILFILDIKDIKYFKYIKVIITNESRYSLQSLHHLLLSYSLGTTIVRCNMLNSVPSSSDNRSATCSEKSTT
jgi:hypothetical protein